jgi:hypothetical protein
MGLSTLPMAHGTTRQSRVSRFVRGQNVIVWVTIAHALA